MNEHFSYRFNDDSFERLVADVESRLDLSKGLAEILDGPVAMAGLEGDIRESIDVERGLAQIVPLATAELSSGLSAPDERGPALGTATGPAANEHPAGANAETPLSHGPRSDARSTGYAPAGGPGLTDDSCAADRVSLMAAAALTSLGGQAVELLSLAEAAERLAVPRTRVSQMIKHGQLLGVREGDRWMIPAAFLIGDSTVKGLGGVIQVLRDGGFADPEILRWLFSDDNSLPGSPIEALRSDRRREVKRRAQALAF